VAAAASRNVTLAQHNGNRHAVSLEMDRNDPRFVAALRDFDAAVRSFRNENFSRAQELFEKVAAGPARELAERARVHVVLCQQRRARSAPAPKGTEDNYNLGIAELNARHLDAAIEYLSRADRLGDEQEHVKYALAAAHALRGEADLAIGFLQSAIELRPRNRYLARSDADFESLASEARFKALIAGGEARQPGA